MSIGKNIRIYRNRLNLTQEKLAEKAQISQGQLSEYENDRVRPNVEKLGKIADIFGCSVAVLDESLIKVPGMKKIMAGDNNVSVQGDNNTITVDACDRRINDVKRKIQDVIMDSESIPPEIKTLVYSIIKEA